jgi:hypothetical protein
VVELVVGRVVVARELEDRLVIDSHERRGDAECTAVEHLLAVEHVRVHVEILVPEIVDPADLPEGIGDVEGGVRRAESEDAQSRW